MKRHNLRKFIARTVLRESIQKIQEAFSAGQLSHDARLFLQVRQGMKEAIDTTGYPDFIDPEKRQSIENEEDFIENALPDLGPQADRYLEIITSEAYKKACDRAAHYLGVTIEQLHERYPNLHTAMGIMMNTAQSVEQIERDSKPQLEQMAKDVVLNLPENKHIKRLVAEGKIILDVQLAPSDLRQGVSDNDLNQEMRNGMTVQENLDSQVASVLMGDSDTKLRRMFANFIAQGDAINKFFLHNVVSEELATIDPTLPNKYGLLSATSLLMNYWMPNHPFTRDFVRNFAVGSEQVVPSGQNYILKVRGRNFVLLIHELVKAINDYLSMDIASQEELDTEKLSDEMKQFLVGPGIDMRLRQMIPTEKIELLPYIKKLILRLPIDQLKALFMQGGQSQAIMRSVIRAAEQQSRGRGEQ